MIFTETHLTGAFIIDPDPHHDERGFFARTFCRREFEARGLMSTVAQCNISRSLRRGTLRGMHFQLPPMQEAKLVRCIRGALFDVMLDLRSESPTFRQWIGVELTADNGRSVYVPEGFAHGILTLTDDTELHYLITQFYDPQLSSGVRYNDPVFGIEWPIQPAVINERDRSWPDFDPESLRF
ncbi:MAG: dTDP-4-dehydrorhamnose 3,5-epimerase [Phycisphaerales bacterium]|nr:MAG: dTDP-4-dehydrorhamnose 3,5-epimerase [Phycisphaerales bacterium]